MILGPVKFVLGLFRRNTGAAAMPHNLLYEHRLRRDFDKSDTSHAGKTAGLAGKIFIAGLAVIFVFAPWRFAFAAAFLTLDSFSGNPGTIHISGGGWTAGETVSIYLNNAGGAPVAAATAGQDSFFGPTAVSIPANAPQGAMQIIGVGSDSHQTQSNSYYVVPFGPSISVSSSANTPGSAISVSGTGFAPGETVNLAFDTLPAGSVQADTKGSFSAAAVTVPQLSANTYLIHAKGAASGAETVAYFYVGGYYPAASPDNYFLMPGDSLTFSGYNFAPGESIEVYKGQDQAAVTAIIAGGDGSFANAGSVAVPANAPAGILNFTLKSSKTNTIIPLMITVGSFTSLVTPDNYFVMPGQAVKFYGKGFAPNESIQVTQGGLPVASIKTDAGGGFAGAATTTVPFFSAGSTISFKFVGQQSQTSASVDVSVGSLVPQINPSEYYLTPGKSFTIWGTGFAPNEKVDVDAAGATITVTADEYGVFKTAGPFTAPFLPNSRISAAATGQTSGVKASLDLSVGGLYPIVAPDSYYIAPGDQINLSGSGFAPNEEIEITSNQDSLGSVTADQYGNFSNRLVTTPFNGGQTLNYTFTGSKSKAGTSLSITIAQLFPVVSLDTYYAVPGSTIKAQASGFSRGEPVTISVNGNEDLTTTADKTGTTPWVPVTLPLNLTDKTLDIVFTGKATGASGKATVSLAPFNPQITPDTWYAQPGTTVNFSGTGFAAHEDVNVALNGNSAGMATAAVDGELSFSYAIPVSANAARFVFTGAKSGAIASVDISLAPFSPQISPSTYYAAPGSKITFSGSGFASGETVEISLNGSAAGKATVDSKGNFASPAITIPFGSQSAHFAFASSLSGLNQSLDIGVAQLNAGIMLSTYYDAGGAPLTVTGMGFGGTEKIDIDFNGQALGSATTDVNGDFTFSTAIPFGSAGNYSVTAKGKDSGASSSASFTRAQVYSSIQLKDYAGAPGSSITFIGSGYLPGEPINVATDRTGSSIAYAFNADGKGGFSDSGFILPADFKGGPLNLSITGTHSMNTAIITYYVTGP